MEMVSEMVLEMRKSSLTHYHYLVRGNLESVRSCLEFIQQVKNMPLHSGAKVALELTNKDKYSGSLLGFLIEAIKHIRDQGADVILVTQNDMLLDLFELGGIHKIVSILPRVPSGYYKDPETWTAA
jgi:hypothetical protein